MKIPNINVDDSHPDTCSILDDEFIFETVVLSDGHGERQDMIYSTV